jgi:hypothetical protein
LTGSLGVFKISGGGSRKGSKGNAVRAHAHNAAAAPATVSGEPSTDSATGSVLLPGRWSKTVTREPGDLPPATVTRERVGRGVLASTSSTVESQSAKGEGIARDSQNRRDRFVFAVWGVACLLSSSSAAVAVAFPHSVSSSSPHRHAWRLFWQQIQVAHKLRRRTRRRAGVHFLRSESERLVRKRMSYLAKVAAAGRGARPSQNALPIRRKRRLRQPLRRQSWWGFR